MNMDHLLKKPYTVVWRDELDFRIAQGIWLGPWSKAPIGQLEFIENYTI